MAEAAFAQTVPVKSAPAPASGGLETIIQSSHSKAVKAVDLSPDGLFYASAGADNTVRLWDRQGRLFKVHKSFPTDISDMAFLPDGKGFAVAFRDYKLRFYDFSGKETKQLRLASSNSYMYSKVILAFNPDGQSFATNHEGENSVRLWSYPACEPLAKLEIGTREPSEIVYSADGKYLATASLNYSLTWWSLVDNSLLGRAELPSEARSLGFSADSSSVFASTSLLGLKVWKNPREKPLAFAGDKGSKLPESSLVAFSGEGPILALGEKNTIDLYDERGRLVKSHPLTGDVNELTARYLGGGAFLAGFGDGSLRLVDGGKSLAFGSAPAAYSDIAVSPDGLLYAVSEDSDLLVVDLRDGRLSTWPQVKGREILVSPDGGHLVLVLPYRTELWTKDRRRVASFDSVYADHFSEDGRTIIAHDRSKVYRIGLDGSKTVMATPALPARESMPGSACDITEVRALPGASSLYVVASGSNSEGTTFQLLRYDGAGTTLLSKGPLTGNSSDYDLLPANDGSSLYWGRGNGLYLYPADLQSPKEVEENSTLAFAFSPDGSSFIFTEKTEIVVRDLRTKKARRLAGHAAWVKSLAILPGDSLLASLAQDGAIRLWNYRTGDSVSLLRFAVGDWFVSTDSGAFDCSDGGRAMVKFARDGTIYDPDQFWTTAFTPGLLGRFVSGGGLSPASLKDSGALVRDMPLVSIASSAADLSPALGTVTIRVLAKAGSGGLGRILLYHNGRALDEGARGLKVEGTADSRTFTVSLVAGQNSFVAAAWDRLGAVEGRSAPVSLAYTPKALVKPNLYILGVGVSAYRNPAFKLVAPVGDATAFADLLEKTGAGLYGRIVKKTLLDGKATRKGIAEAFAAITAAAGPEDTVLVFFAGHGYTLDKTYYFLSWEADETDLPGTCLAVDGIGDFIKGLASNKVAVFLDTCQSGSAAKSLGQIALARGVDERMAIANLARQRGIIVFAASSESQSSYEIKELGHGIFTYCLIKALGERKAEVALEGLVSAGKLVAMVERMTRDTAFEYLKIEQNPMKYAFGEDFGLGFSK